MMAIASGILSIERQFDGTVSPPLYLFSLLNSVASDQTADGALVNASGAVLLNGSGAQLVANTAAAPTDGLVNGSGAFLANASGSQVIAGAPGQTIVPWFQDPLTMGWYEPSALTDQITVNSAWGPMVAQAGAVPVAAAQIDGNPAWQCRKAAGYLATPSTRNFFGPFRVLIVARFVGSPTADDTLLGDASNNNGSAIQYVDSTHVKARGTTALTSLATNPLAWHCYDITWWGGNFSYVSVDGGAVTRVSIGTGLLDGFSLGAYAGANRADVDVAEVIWLESRAPFALAAQIYAFLSAKFPSLSLGAPASYTETTTIANPPWTFTSPWSCWLQGGQSNALGLGTTASVAVNSNVYVLKYDFSWAAMADPVGNYTNLRDWATVGNIVGAFSGAPAFGNAMQARYGQPFALVPATPGGSTISLGATDYSTWNVGTMRGNVLANCALGALESRALEAQRRGATIRGLIVHQGESEAANGSNAQQDAWLPAWTAAIAHLRTVLGIPNLPVVYVQIQPLTSSAPWTRMRDVVQPQLAGLVTNCVMVSAPNGPYIPASTADHLHLETTALEVLYGTTIPAAIAAQGW